MFFFINWVFSIAVWVFVAYLFSFSILGWIIGLIVSWLYKEFIGPLIIIAIGDNTINKKNGNMNFFGFGKPKWYKILPAYFQPDESMIQEVENFRSRFSLEHDFLAQMISMTPWSVKKLQWFMLRKFKAEQPSWSEKEIWKSVIISRMNVKLMTADFPLDIGSTPLSRAEINDIINRAATIVKGFKSFDEVVNYLLEVDYKENRFYDPGGLLDDLNNILENSWR